MTTQQKNARDSAMKVAHLWDMPSSVKVALERGHSVSEETAEVIKEYYSSWNREADTYAIAAAKAPAGDDAYAYEMARKCRVRQYASFAAYAAIAYEDGWAEKDATRFANMAISESAK